MNPGPTSPPLMSLSEDQAFAYLLGELPEVQAQALEEAALEHQAHFEALRASEGELVDAYLAGRLSAARAAKVEALCRASEQWRSQVATARALRARAKQHPAEAAPGSLRSRFSGRLPFAFASALAVAGAVALLAWPRGTVDVERSLRPVSVRAGDDARPLPVPRNLGVLKLELGLEGEPPRASWEVVVTGPSGEVWRGPPSRADAVAVHVELPASGWARGRYRIDLRSGAEQLAEYALTLAPTD